MDDLTTGLSERDLARYCEAMLYDYEPEWRPSGNVELDRPDVLAWKRSGWPVGYSRLAYARWTADDADAGIEEVLAFFGDTPFNWYVGPSSTPADLEARLVRKGLVVQERPRLMTAALPLQGKWRDAGVRIVEVVDRDLMRQWLAFSHPEGPDDERDLEERMDTSRYPAAAPVISSPSSATSSSRTPGTAGRATVAFSTSSVPAPSSRIAAAASTRASSRIGRAWRTSAVASS